jgi:hypothetical protein
MMRSVSARATRVVYWFILMTTDTDKPSVQIGSVQRSSAVVWCADHCRPAVISVIHRDDAGMRFVLWCSLRACDQCSEGCLNGWRTGATPSSDS